MVSIFLLAKFLPSTVKEELESRDPEEGDLEDRPWREVPSFSHGPIRGVTPAPAIYIYICINSI